MISNNYQEYTGSCNITKGMLYQQYDQTTLNEIFKYKDKKAKDQAIYKARLQYGYTLKICRINM